MNLRKYFLSMILCSIIPLFCVGCGAETGQTKVRKVEAESGQSQQPGSAPPGQVKRIASH